MNRSPPVQVAIARSVLSAVQVDPETRTTSALPADQVAVAASAALAVFDAAGLTPDAAAQADFERDVWDRDSFPEPGPTEVLKIADVWSEAEAAARHALKVRWPRLHTAWMSLRLDGPPPAA